MLDFVESFWYIKYSLSSTKDLEHASDLSATTVKRLAVERKVKQKLLKMKW